MIEDLTDQPVAAASGTVGNALDRYKARRKQSRKTPDDKANKGPSVGPPSAKEWQDFLSGTVLRIATELYLMAVLFRYIDESELTSRERELIRLTKDDLADMAAPMATVASKNKLAKKHGRSVIALADSAESVVDLFIWIRRVNRIARKYKPTTADVGVPQPQDQTVYEGVVTNGQVFGQDGTQGPNIPGYFPGGRG